MIRILVTMAAAIPLAFMPHAQARLLSEPPSWAAPGLASAVDEKLSEPELRDALVAAGYDKIHTIRADAETYEVTAQKGGTPVLLRVNTRTRRFSERPAD